MKKVVIYSLDWRTKKVIEAIAVTRSAAEAAKYTGISQSAVYNHCYGRLTTFLWSKNYTFKYLDSVDNFDCYEPPSVEA